MVKKDNNKLDKPQNSVNDNNNSIKSNMIYKIIIFISVVILISGYLLYSDGLYVLKYTGSGNTPEGYIDIIYNDIEKDIYPDDYISGNITNPKIIVINNYKPEILLVEDLISKDEADFIIEKSLPKLGIASPFQDRDKAYEPKFFSGLNTFLNKGTYPLVTEIEKRISRVMNEPLENIEVCRITRYLYKQFVDNHYDYYMTDEEVFNAGGQRHRTIVIYLTTLNEEDGGGTNFHLVNYTVQPKKGSATVFRNINKKTGQRDKNSRHSSIEVKNPDKEKWVMVFFIKNIIDQDGAK